MTKTYTLGDVARIAAAGAAHFNTQLAVPIGRFQAQGDIWVIPADGQVPAATRPLPTAGTVLVSGRGGNAHIVVGDGPVFWDAAANGSQTIGVLTIPNGSTAFLFHATETLPRRLAEHDAEAYAPGTYVIRRQREQADEIRLIAD